MWQALVLFSLVGVWWLVGGESGPFVWPMPTSQSISEDLQVYYASDFAFETSSQSDVVMQALQRYQRLTFPHVAESTPPDGNQVAILNVQVGSDDETLSYGMDESYALTVTQTNATLSAKTVWGTLRGLETFSQLVVYDFVAGYYVGFTADVTDAPRFSHRGLLIDTSRHFQPVDVIIRLLEAMSYAKLNVLHWHLVDSQSFPYESEAWPKLWQGAYTVYERYSQNDVREVVAHAKYMGIRVIPEFDMPGHAQSWCTGYPDICPSPTCLTPLNPAVDATWDLIDGLIGEARNDVFTDDWIHLGGDEVQNKECWTETPSIAAWMQEQNMTAEQTYGYFVIRAMNIAYYEYEYQVINWVEVFNDFNKSLDPNVTVIEVWKSKQSLAAAVEMGFRAILADDDLWYLDHLSVTWDQMYLNEPFADIPDKESQARVLGGEACMWGETVDPSDIENTVWPRAAAVAERLWSPMDVDDTSAALPRIEYFRCLLNQRGIGAAPVNNAVARQPPPRPGSCYDQRRR